MSSLDIYRDQLSFWIWLWPALLIFVIFIYSASDKKQNRMNAGFSAAYLVIFFMQYWPGAVVNSLSWYDAMDLSATAKGFEHASYGWLALIAGFFAFSLFRSGVLTKPKIVKQRSTMTRPPLEEKPVHARYTPWEEKALSTLYLAIGLITYFVLVPFLHGMPTLTVAMIALSNFVITGICLRIWVHWKNQQYYAASLWLAGSFLFPIISVMFRGFLGTGIESLIVIACFVNSFYRRRWLLFLIIPFLIYLGTSFFINYMRERTLIREAIWQTTDYTQRLKVTSNVLTDFEFYDIRNKDHNFNIDGRLNQSLNLGLTVQRLESGVNQFAGGDTLLDGLKGMIPRFLWPEKPLGAGAGGKIVTKYTGLYFQEGTSVGMPQVMELYINFGLPGVLCGMFILGIIIEWINHRCGRALQEEDYPSLVLWQIAGLGFLQVGTGFYETLTATVASWGTIYLLNRLLLSHLKKQQRKLP